MTKGDVVLLLREWQGGLTIGRALKHQGVRALVEFHRYLQEMFR